MPQTPQSPPMPTARGTSHKGHWWDSLPRWDIPTQPQGVWGCFRRGEVLSPPYFSPAVCLATAGIFPVDPEHGYSSALSWGLSPRCSLLEVTRKPNLPSMQQIRDPWPKITLSHRTPWHCQEGGHVLAPVPAWHRVSYPMDSM